MTVALTHLNAADSSFSTVGAAAWNAGHVLTGAANSVPFFGGAGNALTDSANLVYDDSTKRFTVGTGSGTSAGFTGGYAGSPGYFGIYSTSQTPSSTNGILMSNGTVTYIQGEAIYFRKIDGTPKMVLNNSTAGAGPSITAGTAASAVSLLSGTQTRNFSASATDYVSLAFTTTATHADDNYLNITDDAASMFKVLLGGQVRVPIGGGFTMGTGNSSGFVVNSAKVAGGSAVVFGFTGNIPEDAIDTGWSRGGAGIHAFGTGAAGSKAGSLAFTEAQIEYTNTAGGTTGNQTINKTSGSVNFAATATTLTVTNSFVTTNSHIFCTVATNDGTATLKNAVPGTGSFVITLAAAATAETKVNFLVIN